MHAQRDTVTVNLSTRPSHSVYCIKTNARIVKLFAHLVGHDSSDSSATDVTKFQGNPLSGVLNTPGRWVKIAIFDRNRCLSQKPYKQAHDYYSSLTGSYKEPTDQRQFQ